MSNLADEFAQLLADKIIAAFKEANLCNCNQTSTTDPPTTIDSINNIPKTSQFYGSLTANDLVDKLTVGWNLGNSLDCTSNTVNYNVIGTTSESFYYETMWGNPVTTKKIFETVKQKGFNAIRIPITWSHHLSSDFEISANWMNRVKEIIDMVLDLDMVCIINTHHDDANYGGEPWREWLYVDPTTIDTVLKNLETVWSQIATTFKDYDKRLIFEGYNELQDKANSWNKPTEEQYNLFNRISQKFVDTVRSTGKMNSYRYLLINTYYTGSDNLNWFKVPSDKIKDRIIIGGHPYSDELSQDLETVFLPYIESTINKGYPFIVGEMGTKASMKLSFREINASNYVARALTHGIKCFWWDASDYKLLDRNLCTWVYESVVDSFVGGLVASPNTEVINNIFELSNINLWEFGSFDNKGKKLETNNSIRLKQPLDINSNNKYVINITDMLTGAAYRTTMYVCYDANMNVVYSKKLADAYFFTVLIPPNAKYLNFNFYNPWGTRTLDYYNNLFVAGNLTVNVKEIPTTEQFIDDTLRTYENLNLSDFTNWVSGEYNTSGNVVSTTTSRVRVKGLLKCNGNTFYTTTLNVSDLCYVIREYDNNLDFINNYGSVEGNGCFKTNPYTNYVGISIYSTNSNPISYDTYEQYFSNNINASITLIEGINEFLLIGSDCLNQTTLLDDGTTASLVGTTRTTPMLYVGDVDHNKDLYLIIPEGSQWFSEYDKNLRLIKSTSLKRIPKFHLTPTTQYIRCCSQKILATTAIRIMYFGSNIKVTNYDINLTFPNDSNTIKLSEFTLWQSGDYLYTDGKYTKASNRICIKPLIKYNPTTSLKAYISNSSFALLIRTYDSSQTFIGNAGVLKNQQSITFSSNVAYLGISFYNLNNNSFTYDDYKSAFESGLQVSLQPL